jgi:hypothetical protein
MALTGPQFTADLVQLSLVGSADLPTLAYTYASLNNKVAGTSASDAGEFQQRGAPGAWDQVAEPWTYLRNRLQEILGKTAQTLETTGQVLVHVVEVYKAADTTVAASFAGAWRDGLPPGAAPTETVPSGPPPAVILPTS